MSSPLPAPLVPHTRPRVFFEGRYRKLVRDLPQTIFYCPECKGHGCPRCEGFGKLTRDSVQELIARAAMPLFKADRHAHKFHGAGREDVDVRMLGGGRPFVFEIERPRQPRPDLAELARQVNERCAGRLELLDLRWCERARVAEVKDRRHAKDYRLRARCERAVDLEPIRARLRQRIVLRQRTPDRVSHRRADLERERWIEIRAVEALDSEARDADGAVSPCFALTVRSEHGTYIKEAVSGDGGRTTPSIAEWLAAPCACEELDVLDLLDEAGGRSAEPAAAP